MRRREYRQPERGRLLDASAAPDLGEDVTVVARAPGFSVEQILSGDIQDPVDYRQDHDEWVVVIAGGATVEVSGEVFELGTGDWLWLPADVPHCLQRTDPGTSWLAIRGDTK